MIRCVLIGLCAIGMAVFGLIPAAHSALPQATEVRVVTDEADAVLAIIEKRKADRTLTPADWQRLFSSEGYTRLKKREAGMGRAFQDDEFKAFVLSDNLSERAALLKETLDKWKSADITASVNRALVYLPKGARIRAKIYPAIKPRENSFVFETDKDPAIFLYVDPAKTKEEFENTLSHELHHIGYADSCAARLKSEGLKKLPENVRTVIGWAGAFGEGLAMLAAAGGPDTHPHATSSEEDRARWDKDVANFNEDLKKVESFFLDILEKRLIDEKKIQEVGFSFFGVQGPWYTVGWKMAVTIEKTYGRAELINSICDPGKLLETYNGAAAKYNRTAREPLALWSKSLIEGVGKARHQKLSN